jgi:hypothetical protein
MAANVKYPKNVSTWKPPMSVLKVLYNCMEFKVAPRRKDKQTLSPHNKSFLFLVKET